MFACLQQLFNLHSLNFLLFMAYMEDICLYSNCKIYENNKPILLFNKEIWWSFTYIDDVVKILSKLTKKYQEKNK